MVRMSNPNDGMRTAWIGHDAADVLRDRFISVGRRVVSFTYAPSTAVVRLQAAGDDRTMLPVVDEAKGGVRLRSLGPPG